MAVNRIWFPNAPGGTAINQRTQLALGYSGIIPAVASIVDYFRRYLQDTTTVQEVSAPSEGFNLTPVRETFYTKQQTFTLSNSTQTNVDVFVNGLLMSDGDDYFITSNTLVFNNQIIGDSPIIQVHYWI